jgi:uncharacterized protein YecT (DUF1311 family)
VNTLVRNLLLLLLFISTSASAWNCGDLNTQSEMNQCAFTEYQKEDKELNKIYNSYRTRLDDDQKRQLKSVQLAWVKFRDLVCEFESSGVKGGSVYPLILQSCLARVTSDRIKELSILANCKEGDLSCPAWE